MCGYAHKLKELMPPMEGERTYEGVWKDGVHRWYGQDMPAWSIAMVRKYYINERRCDIPVWAHGLRWYVSESQDIDRSLPVDFGIEQDWEVVRMRRTSQVRPFYWAPAFWERIADRNEIAGSMPTAPEEVQPVSSIPTPSYGRILPLARRSA